MNRSVCFGFYFLQILFDESVYGMPMPLECFVFQHTKRKIELLGDSLMRFKKKKKNVFFVLK